MPERFLAAKGSTFGLSGGVASFRESGLCLYISLSTSVKIPNRVRALIILTYNRYMSDSSYVQSIIQVQSKGKARLKF
jgi:hypothetical protein